MSKDPNPKFTAVLYGCKCGLVMLCLDRSKPVEMTRRQYRELKSFANGSRLHFVDGIKDCPECRRPLDLEKDKLTGPTKTLTDANGDAPGDALLQEIAILQARSFEIRSLRKLTDKANSISVEIASQTELIRAGAASTGQDLDLRDHFVEAAAAVGGLSNRLTLFKDELLRAAASREAEQPQ